MILKVRTDHQALLGVTLSHVIVITRCKGVLELLEVTLTFGTDFTSLFDEVYLRQLRSQTTQSNHEKFA